VKIHAEGGGDGQLNDTLFREGWASFFRAAGLAGRMPRVVRGKGREQTIANFLRALDEPEPDTLPLLLVDSEGPVPAGKAAWEYLRESGTLHVPAAAGPQVFLMVQLMETWFLADRDLLRRYFGAALRENALRAWPDLEAVPKQTVLETLHRATANTSIRYEKGKVSFALLKQLDPARVEAACPRARAFLEHLRTL
jgi:hypothetical protein